MDPTEVKLRAEIVPYVGPTEVRIRACFRGKGNSQSANWMVRFRSGVDFCIGVNTVRFRAKFTSCMGSTEVRLRAGFRGGVLLHCPTQKTETYLLKHKNVNMRATITTIHNVLGLVHLNPFSLRPLG